MFMGWDDRPPRRHIGFDSPEGLRQILTRSSPPHSCFLYAYYDDIKLKCQKKAER